MESGTSPDADTVIETDPATLFCIASGQTSIGDAVKTKALKVTGDRPTPSGFSRFFSFDDRASRHASSSTSESRST